MPWVNEPTLGRFLDQAFDDRTRLNRLRTNFQKAVAEMERMGVAHGDLQHGNMLISGSGDIRLIDYDGMYVPGMPKFNASELGHANYQSPFRNMNTTLGPSIDRFSSIVIDLALDALIQDSSLWTKFSAGGNNIIFSVDDFLKPDASEVLSRISALPGFSGKVDNFKILCRAPVDQLPSLADFTRAQFKLQNVNTASLPSGAALRSRQFDVVSALDRQSLMARVGDQLEVVGLVVEIKRDFARNRQPYVFINFGDWRARSFKLVLWSEALDLFENEGFALDSLVGSWLSITGLIQSYQGSPQVEIESPGEIKILAGQQAAKAKLDGMTKPVSSPQTSNGSRSIQDQNKNLRAVFGSAPLPTGIQSTAPTSVPPVTSKIIQPPTNVNTSATTFPGSSSGNQRIRQNLQNLSMPTNAPTKFGSSVAGTPTVQVQPQGLAQSVVQQTKSIVTLPPTTQVGAPKSPASMSKRNLVIIWSLVIVFLVAILFALL